MLNSLNVCGYILRKYSASLCTQDFLKHHDQFVQNVLVLKMQVTMYGCVYYLAEKRSLSIKSRLFGVNIWNETLEIHN